MTSAERPRRQSRVLRWRIERLHAAWPEPVKPTDQRPSRWLDEARYEIRVLLRAALSGLGQQPRTVV